MKLPDMQFLKVNDWILYRKMGALESWFIIKMVIKKISFVIDIFRLDLTLRWSRERLLLIHRKLKQKMKLLQIQMQLLKNLRNIKHVLFYQKMIIYLYI